MKFEMSRAASICHLFAAQPCASQCCCNSCSYLVSSNWFEHVGIMFLVGYQNESSPCFLECVQLSCDAFSCSLVDPDKRLIENDHMFSLRKQLRTSARNTPVETYCTCASVARRSIPPDNSLGIFDLSAGRNPTFSSKRSISLLKT